LTEPEFGLTEPEFGLTEPEFGLTEPEFGAEAPHQALAAFDPRSDPARTPGVEPRA